MVWNCIDQKGGDEITWSTDRQITCNAQTNWSAKCGKICQFWINAPIKLALVNTK